MPCKQAEPGAVPGRSTISFWSGAPGVRGRLLTVLRQVRVLRPEPICCRRLMVRMLVSQTGDAGSVPADSTMHT